MKFEILGTPISKKRHRVVRRGKFIASYDPQHDLKNRIRSLLLSEMKKNNWVMYPSHIALEVKIIAYFPIPEYLTKKEQNIFKWGFGNHKIKQDSDNVFKFFSDSANKIVYADDKQIVDIYCEKKHVNRFYPTPRTIIYVTPYQDLKDYRVEEILGIFSPQDTEDLIEALELIKTKYNEFSRIPDVWEQESFCNALSKIALAHAEKLRKINKINERYLNHENSETLPENH